MARARTRTLVALALAGTCWACASASSASAQTTGAATCPGTFNVLHNDSVGALYLPAGPYVITVLNASTLSCSDASELFREFLEDYDGRLAGGWRVDPSTATFTRRSQGFRVTAGAPTPPTPPSKRVCSSYFTILHNDHIGSFAIRKGRYRITLLSVGRISCAQASDDLARFLQDFDGILPRPWFVDPSTGPSCAAAATSASASSRGAARCRRAAAVAGTRARVAGALARSGWCMTTASAGCACRAART